MQSVRASCYMGLNSVLRDATSTHGSTPWVVLAASNEMSARSAMIDERVLTKSYKIPLENILRIECFDGDPFDYPNATLFSDSTAKQISSFLEKGYWSSGVDLVVSCPTGISISPSIAKGLHERKSDKLNLVLHPTKPPKFSNRILKSIAQHVF